MDRISRRRLLAGFGAALVGSPALAAGTDVYPLTSDFGTPLRNQRVPSDLDPTDLAGAVWAGSANPDVILIEFFDYNCPFCRAAAAPIDALLTTHPQTQLRLFNNAILAPGSVDAAKVQQAVLRAFGPHVAYAFHRKLLAVRGPADREVALDVARAMGLKMTAVNEGVDLPRVAAVLGRQLKAARALDLTATPSFLLEGSEIFGWPGPNRLDAMLRSAQTCGEPSCAHAKSL